MGFEIASRPRTHPWLHNVHDAIGAKSDSQPAHVDQFVKTTAYLVAAGHEVVSGAGRGDVALLALLGRQRRQRRRGDIIALVHRLQVGPRIPTSLRQLHRQQRTPVTAGGQAGARTRTDPRRRYARRRR